MLSVVFEGFHLFQEVLDVVVVAAGIVADVYYSAILGELPEILGSQLMRQLLNSYFN